MRRSSRLLYTCMHDFYDIYCKRCFIIKFLQLLQNIVTLLKAQIILTTLCSIHLAVTLTSPFWTMMVRLGGCTSDKYNRSTLVTQYVIMLCPIMVMVVIPS